MLVREDFCRVANLPSFLMVATLRQDTEVNCLQLLGVDPNNCIFSIAIVVVEVEDTPNWETQQLLTKISSSGEGGLLDDD